MIKSKLMKALMLGVCMSALTTGVAFAQLKPNSEPVKGAVVSEEENKLYAKQKEIDQYVFTDHVDEMAKLDFTVNYTGVNGDVVEIGISPYSDENAAYLYDIFGKDEVSVIAADENMLYNLASSSGIAEPGIAIDPEAVDAGAGTDVNAAGGAATDGQPLDDQIYTTTSATDGVVTDADVNKAPETPATDGRVYKGSDVQIQIESTADDAAAADNSDIKTVAAAENAEVVKAADEDSNAVSTSVIILIIAAGAALVGGTIIISNKKKAGK